MYVAMQAHKRRGRPRNDAVDPFGAAMKDIRERCDRALELRDIGPMNEAEILILETIRGMASE
jgi:hypothetical protein